MEIPLVNCKYSVNSKLSMKIYRIVEINSTTFLYIFPYNLDISDLEIEKEIVIS